MARQHVRFIERRAAREQGVHLGNVPGMLLQPVLLHPDVLVDQHTIRAQVVQVQNGGMAVERAPEIVERMFPAGWIERAVVDRPDQNSIMREPTVHW